MLEGVSRGSHRALRCSFGIEILLDFSTGLSIVSGSYDFANLVAETYS